MLKHNDLLKIWRWWMMVYGTDKICMLSRYDHKHWNVSLPSFSNSMVVYRIHPFNDFLAQTFSARLYCYNLCQTCRLGNRHTQSKFFRWSFITLWLHKSLSTNFRHFLNKDSKALTKFMRKKYIANLKAFTLNIFRSLEFFFLSKCRLGLHYFSCVLKPSGFSRSFFGFGFIFDCSLSLNLS